MFHASPEAGQTVPATPPTSSKLPYTETPLWRNGTNRAIPLSFAFGPHHPDALAAFEIHRDRAESMGQRWSDAHANAFRELHNAYVCTGLNLHQGRTAWPLAVGTGKTQSLVAFAVTQAERARSGRPPMSLLVCIERVDQGGDLYRSMIDAGVPADMLGVYHRKPAREVAEEGLLLSVTEAEAQSCLILIATHAMMMKGDDFIAKVNTYQGRERSLVVWDESLIKSQGRHFDLARVEGAAAVLRSAVSDTQSDALKDARDAFAYIDSCTKQLREEFTKGLAGTTPVTVELPHLTPEDETRYHTAIVEALKGNDMMWTGSRRSLVDFLEHVQRPLRVVPYLERGRRVGVVHYLTRIPESLSRLIVLDASHNIRRLTSEHDTSLRVTPVNCKVKSFRNVKVKHYVRGAGREALDKQLPRKDSPLVKHLMGTLSAIPSDEAAVVATFKPQMKRDERLGKTHADYIKRHMTRAGFDPEEKLVDGRPRWVFLTWGQHVGVSRYAYCKHAVAVGVLRRDNLDIASSIVGQRDNLAAVQASDPAEVHAVVLSEMFHAVTQFGGRGDCRTTIDGLASSMTLSVYCSESFPADWWDEAMPDSTVEVIHADAKERKAKADGNTEALLKTLAELPTSHDKVTVRTLKVLAGLQSMQPNRFSELLKTLKPIGWVREERTFVRCPFADVT